MSFPASLGVLTGGVDRMGNVLIMNRSPEEIEKL